MPHVHRHAHPAKHRAPAAYRHRPFGAGAQPEPPAPCARGRPPRVWAVAKADAYGHGQPSAGGAGRGGRPGRARCRRGLARDRPGLARPHPGSGRIVRPARSRHLPGMSLDLVVGAMDQLDWLASARAARRPSGCAGRATWAMPASMPATIPTPIAAPRRWPPGTRIGGRPSAALRERRGSRQALSVRPRLRPGDRRPARPGQPQQLGRVADSGRGAPTEDWIRPGLALYGASPLPEADGARSACGR